MYILLVGCDNRIVQLQTKVSLNKSKITHADNLACVLVPVDGENLFVSFSHK